MLGKKLDKQQYALKGGCNLRFFFGSPRYSQDMDLDLGDMPAHVVRDKVNAILESMTFRRVLAAGGLYEGKSMRLYCPLPRRTPCL